MSVTRKLDSMNQKLLLQPHDYFGSLVKDAEFINYPFQEWVSSWLNSEVDSNLDSISKYLWSATDGVDPEFVGLFPGKDSQDKISGVHVRGPVKHIDRAIAKVIFMIFTFSIRNIFFMMNQAYRAYGGDFRRLTDLVRCSVVLDTPDDMVRLLNVRILQIDK
jgi:hypothetical protein